MVDYEKYKYMSIIEEGTESNSKPVVHEIKKSEDRANVAGIKSAVEGLIRENHATASIYVTTPPDNALVAELKDRYPGVKINVIENAEGNKYRLYWVNLDLDTHGYEFGNLPEPQVGSLHITVSVDRPDSDANQFREYGFTYMTDWEFTRPRGKPGKYFQSSTIRAGKQGTSVSSYAYVDSNDPTQGKSEPGYANDPTRILNNLAFLVKGARNFGNEALYMPNPNPVLPIL